MEPDLYETIVELRRQGLGAALATIISRKGSTPRKDAAKMLIFEDGRQLGTVGGGCLEAEVCREAQSVMRLERPKILKFDLTDEDAEDSGLICGGTMEVLVEPIMPKPCLFIFGAGHIGVWLAKAAQSIGFKLVVVDDRVKYANRKRFPDADVVQVDAWEEAFEKLRITASSYIVIATRGHKYDLACLRFAVQTPAKYIGLLGSKRKAKLFFETLTKEGLDPEQLRRVYTPVGIEIGSETPEEIAISIAAELIAVRKNLQVHNLKNNLVKLGRSAPTMAPQK